MNDKVTAVVVCAGNSTRMGGTDKIFTEICGVPVIGRTLAACNKSACIAEIVAVSKPENSVRLCEIARRFAPDKPFTAVSGGDTRAKSVINGVQGSSSDYVAIMDGARPLVSPELIDEVCHAAFEYGAAAAGIAVTDTVKRTDGGGNIITTVDRNDLVRMQTPQVFLKNTYLELARLAAKSGREFTDDCAVYEYFNKQVRLVDGSKQNIKITVKDDVELCSRLCSGGEVRVGHGYDVHRLVAGRGLWLCGEKIEFELGLLGHSDADVALHALIDSMLGAAAMGDIGTLFPDSDDKFKDISSILLLKEAAKLVFSHYRFGNCDITIVAQKPKLLPYIQKMRQNIADALDVSCDRVNIKATTEEKLGFTGALEGISAHSVCSLYSL